MATEKAKKKAKLRHAEYYDFQKVQDKLFIDSANGKTFKHLVEIIAMPENIRLAYRNLKRNSGSKTPGTDGKTILALARLTDEELITKVQNKLKWYVPQSVRRVEIPKRNDSSKTRPLGIPTIMDRLIQQCVLQVLEPICEAKFHDHSYGFRPNRSQEHAIAQVHKDMQRSHLHYVVDVDIKGFFDNVNHGKLLKQMWTMGIRDKKLISIISTMLKAEVAGVGFPEKGTPQGGIISPLLSNIVLNELDWWLASQWEEMPTVYPYKGTVNPNGSVSRSHKFEALRRSNLKVVTSVRFADDFKIFTNSYSNAQKLYYATRDWLKERLSLDISPEKSKVINLRERYSEFLGFKIKLIPRGKNKDGSTRYVVKSHIRDKSIAQMKPKLKQLIYEIEHPKSTGKEVYRAVSRYNAYVSGLHNYYRLATKVCDDLSPFAISVHKSLKARLKERVKTAKQVRKYKIPCTTPLYIKEKYGKSMQMRYVEGHALIPIGYISHTPPKSMNRAINSYTPEGRTAIHKSLDRIDISVLHDIMRNPLLCESVEFNDNRLSLYSAQQGKCAISGEKLTMENIRCLRKVPKYKHGTDEYKNLILVTDTIAKLIDIRDTEKLDAWVKTLKLTDKQYKKLTELRKLANC